MEIERLSARVEADTIPAEVALERLDRKLDKVADDRSARISIFYTESGKGGGGGIPGSGGGGGGGGFGFPDLIPGEKDNKRGGGGGGSMFTNMADHFQEITANLQKLPKMLDAVKTPMEGVGQAATDMGGTVAQAGGSMGKMGKAGIGLVAMFVVLLPAIMSIIPAIIVLGGYVLLLVAAFAPLVGILFALPGLFLGAIAVIGTFMLIMKPLIEAFQKKSEAEENAEQSARDLANANNSLIQSQINLQRATEAYNKSRRDAAEAIEDGQFAAESAQLSEERAVLALEKAYKRLADVQANLGGKTEEITKVTDDFTGKQFEVARITYDAASSQDDLADAQLGVREAELSLRMAKDAREDTEIRLAELEARGIERSTILEDRTLALAAAENALADAKARKIEVEEAANPAEGEDALGENGQELVDQIYELINGPLKELGEKLIEVISPALISTLDALMPLIDSLELILTPIAEGLGTMFQAIAEELGKEETVEKLVKFGDGLGTFLSAMGPVLATFLTGFLDLIIAAEPLMLASMEILQGLADEFAKWAAGDSEMGDLGPWFEETALVLQDTLDIIFSLMGAFSGFMEAARPFATELRNGIKDWAAGLNEDANSEEGQSDMAAFFERIQEPLDQLSGLFGDIFKGLLDVFGSDDAMDMLTNFLKTTREDVLPAILDFLDMMITSGLLDGIIDMVGSLVKMQRVLWDLGGMELSMAVLGAVLSGLSVLLDFIAEILSWVSDPLGDAFGVAADWLGNIDWSVATDWIRDSMKDGALAFLEWLGGTEVISSIGDIAVGIWEAFFEPVGTAIMAVVEMMSGLLDPLIGVANAAIRGLNLANPFADIPYIKDSTQRKADSNLAAAETKAEESRHLFEAGLGMEQGGSEGIEMGDLIDMVREFRTENPDTYDTNLEVYNTFNNNADPAEISRQVAWGVTDMFASAIPHMVAAPKTQPNGSAAAYQARAVPTNRTASNPSRIGGPR